MLDPNIIRKEPERVRAGIASKGYDPALTDRFLDADQKWRAAVKRTDELRAALNQLSRERKIDEAKKVKTELAAADEACAARAKERDALLEQFPNLPEEGWPVGKSEAENVVVREVGKKPNFKFPPKDYLSLAQNLGIIDTERAAKVAGSRFGYLLGEAALLEFALVQFAFETLAKKGFRPVIPPVMLRPEAYRGMGRLNAKDMEERYFLPKDRLYLAGSAEHTIGPMHMDETFDHTTLPLRYAGFSTCFRREAGSYGKDTKGILRVHQFDKVEMFSFAAQETSKHEHEFLLSCQEELMQTIRLPYRVVKVCTGDMGFPDAAQYDIEAWLPSEGRYRETHSCSNTTDFQARGLTIKYRPTSNHQPPTSHFVHMLNATACAIGRTLIAIFENYQTKDGGIEVPKVLRKYLSCKVIKS